MDRLSGKSIVSLVCGIISFVPLIGIISGIVSIVFSIFAKKEIKNSYGAITGEGFVIAGYVCAIVGLVINIILLFLFLLFRRFLIPFEYHLYQC